MIVVTNATFAAASGALTIVTKDYANANFGAGNAFARRAYVTGAGLIVGQNAAQGLIGDVTQTGASTYTLDIGAVQGGTTGSASFQIANTGTGADIRGAVQTAANGGNITDARLSGTGVTAGNFGPVAAGGATGAYTVTLDANAGGSLSGQSLAIVSNFDNVATQIVNLEGIATVLAQGIATPAGPVNLGNFRVGGVAPSQSFSVENLTAGAGAERLGVGSVSASGNFAGANNLGVGLVDPGATQTNAVSAAVNGGVAGVNTGTLTIQYVSNGQLIDASFTNLATNSQLIELSATGYNAAVGSTTPSPVVIGNQRVGGTLSQGLTVQNTAPAGAFSEALNAAFGANTGNAVNNGGAVNLLAAGARPRCLAR